MIKTKRMMVLDKGMERVPLTFTRASVAYDYQGNSVPVNTPRFEHLIGGSIERGVLIEEAHTNLLTANQSTCTDTLGNITGFVEYRATATSSTDKSIQGSKSLKITTTGEYNMEGARTSNITVSSSTTHTSSGWAWIPEGAVIKCSNSVSGIGAGSVILTGTGDWQYFYIPYNTGAGTAQYTTFYTEGQQAITFYVDMLQLSATPYPLSWTLGGTTQAVETLTAPSGRLRLGKGTIELELLPNSVIKTKGVQQYIINSSDGDGNNQTILLDDTSNNLTVSTKASDAATTVSYADSNLTLNTWTDIAATYNSGNLKLYTAGTSRGTPSESPNLPATQQTVYIGSKYDETLQANTLIKNVVLGRDLRSDTEVTARSNTPGFGADRMVTLIAPLTHSLQAYKVARG